MYFDGLAVFRFYRPTVPRRVIRRRNNSRIEGDIPFEVEFVRDEFEILKRFRLGREMFGPFPLVEYFIGKGIIFLIKS